MSLSPSCMQSDCPNWAALFSIVQIPKGNALPSTFTV